MSRNRKAKERKRKAKLKEQRKVGDKGSLRPSGVIYCEAEKKPIGFVRIQVGKRKNTMFVKQKAKAKFWREGNWLKGYEPDEQELLRMRDGAEVLCPKCKGKASFIVMWGVKVVDDISKELNISEQDLKQLDDAQALKDFDAEHIDDIMERMGQSIEELADLGDVKQLESLYSYLENLLEESKAIPFVKRAYYRRLKLAIEREHRIRKRMARKK